MGLGSKEIFIEEKAIDFLSQRPNQYTFIYIDCSDDTLNKSFAVVSRSLNT